MARAEPFRFAQPNGWTVSIAHHISIPGAYSVVGYPSKDEGAFAHAESPRWFKFADGSLEVVAMTLDAMNEAAAQICNAPPFTDR